MIITGGNGMTERDHIPEAMIPLLDEGIDGFGGLYFRKSVPRRFSRGYWVVLQTELLSLPFPASPMRAK